MKSLILALPLLFASSAWAAPTSSALPAASAERPALLWLEHPPASEFAVVSVLAYTGKAGPQFKTEIGRLAESVGATAVLEGPRDAISTSVWTPEGTIPPGTSFAATRTATETLYFIRFTGKSPFLAAYRDPRANTIRSADSRSLFRFEPGEGYERVGEFVLSPFARDQPPINTIGLPRGTTIVCPYTKHLFVLW